MIKSLLNWFKQPDMPDTSSSPNRAAAALMMEVVMADDILNPAELAALPSLLSSLSALSIAECTELVDIAKHEHASAASIHQFTSHINEHFSLEQKLELLTSLWRIAIADDNIDKYEEHIIRRIADLLHLRHSEFIQCKHAALKLSN